MRKNLGTFHPDFAYYEQPGAGHWWGNACMDWPPLIDFLSRHSLPARESVHQVDFVTASPGISAWCHWLGIEAQTHPLQLSSVHVHYDPEKRTFSGTTDNVARLTLDLGHLPPGKPIVVELDGQKLAEIAWPAAEKRIWLGHQPGKWALVDRPSPALKGPERYGPFKEVFRNRPVLVYGTRGTPEENAWAYSRARYDAETFWYRGNGVLELVADEAFAAAAYPDRNVVLYGNAQNNAAWHGLLNDSPVQVEHGRVRVGQRLEEGEDLACLFIRPRPGSARALVGAVAGSGIVGMRLSDRWPYFMSGVSYPDCVVADKGVLTKGKAGLRVVGFFGPGWDIESGDFAWATTK
jgi:hypothetical protein